MQADTFFDSFPQVRDPGGSLLLTPGTPKLRSKVINIQTTRRRAGQPLALKPAVQIHLSREPLAELQTSGK